MTHSHADGTYPIDFAIPAENLPAATEAIRAAAPGQYDDHDTAEDTVIAYMQDVIGGEIEADEQAVRLQYLDMGTSSLGHNIEEGKARLNVIAPYIRPENPDHPESFLVMPWFKKIQRWSVRDGQIAVEIVKIEYTMLEIL